LKAEGKTVNSNNFASAYFDRQGRTVSLVTENPSDKLKYIVVIPSYCEPDIRLTLDSLWECEKPVGAVEVIVIVNSAENSPDSVIEANRKTSEDVVKWVDNHISSVFKVHLIEIPDMPAKHAGVGLARKTGMDEAAWRFNMLGKPEGLIICFDADSVCDKDYFTEIEKYSDKLTSANGFNIYFEHPVNGSQYSESIYRNITQYELHLRYINQFLRFSGFPFAYHTIGSSFAVRASVYTSQGGMSMRKAGEDFYFLHKVIPLGNFYEINTTRVIPSPRISDRVPFGTGAAISKLESDAEKPLTTYNPVSFYILKEFLLKVSDFYLADENKVNYLIKMLNPLMQNFLLEKAAIEKIKEINNNSRSLNKFVKRFFNWFDAFMIVKFLNYASINNVPKIDVKIAAQEYLNLLEILPSHTNNSLKSLLDIYRRLEREQIFKPIYQ